MCGIAGLAGELDREVAAHSVRRTLKTLDHDGILCRDLQTPAAGQRRIHWSPESGRRVLADFLHHDPQRRLPGEYMDQFARPRPAETACVDKGALQTAWRQAVAAGKAPVQLWYLFVLEHWLRARHG